MALVGFVGLALLVCAAGGVLAAGAGSGWFLSLARPAGTPPAWLFVAAWGIGYVLLGLGGWLVWRRSVTVGPLRLWGWQLALGALWAPAFFGLHRPLFGLGVLLVLIPLTALMIRRFADVDRLAAGVLVPYLLATGYCFYLDAGFCWLNPG